MSFCFASLRGSWANPFICIVLLPQRSQEVERKVSCVWFCSATDGWKGHVGFDLCWRAALDRCGGKKQGNECLVLCNSRSGLLEWKQGKKCELKHQHLFPLFIGNLSKGFSKDFWSGSTYTMNADWGIHLPLIAFCMQNLTLWRLFMRYP